jgi:hypothetical protein
VEREPRLEGGRRSVGQDELILLLRPAQVLGVQLAAAIERLRMADNDVLTRRARAGRRGVLQPIRCLERVLAGRDFDAHLTRARVSVPQAGHGLSVHDHAVEAGYWQHHGG